MFLFIVCHSGRAPIFIFHKHVSLLETSISLIFLVCLTRLAALQMVIDKRGKLTKLELTKLEVNQMVTNDVGIDTMKIDEVGS